MKTPGLWTLAAAASLLGGCRTAGSFDARGRAGLAETVIAGWSEPSRLTAAKTLARYGPPDAIAERALGWNAKGRWLRVVVRDGDPDALEVAVSYRVPEGGRRAVAEFARGVSVSGDGSELSARARDESLDVLALNLADEVARGERTPADARRAYEETSELALAGKSSPYTRALRF